MDIKILANYILATCSDMNLIKLQNLLYYIKAWSLVAKRPLISAPFKKGAYGPINLDLYHSYKQYGSQSIPQPTAIPDILENDKKLIDMILSAYADKSAFALSAMTHKEPPWTETADNAEINEETILAYYSGVPFAKNFQNGGDGPFYLLQDDNWHAFTLDMTPDDAETMASVSSYAEYQERRAKAKQIVAPFLEKIWSVD